MGYSGKTTIQKWVASYKAMGKESLKRSRQIKSYYVQIQERCGRVILNYRSVLSRSRYRT